jgi:26S proteasome regulatory subunit N6
MSSQFRIYNLTFQCSYSYFFESFEGFNTLNDTLQAALSLKYMLLCKIMTNSPSDVHAIVHGKAGIKYAGADVDAMRALAEAHKERSLKSFQSCLQQYKVQLQDDPVISAHIVNLYEALLDANMLRILEPFSRVQIAHVAKLIDLPLQRVEAKYAFLYRFCLFVFSLLNSACCVCATGCPR